MRKDDDLIYNGKAIKLWGLNVCYASCAPEKELADKRAGFYAKYGVNSVRLHKYADGPGWAGIQSAESFAKFDPAGLDRLDYFIAQLKKKGIYVKLSSTFGVKLGPADRQAVPYMDEFGALKGGKGRVATGHGSVFLSREIQDLQIGQIVSILKHRNRYTGLTYAEDPAVAVVELFNEDSALFYGTMGRLQKIPTLRKRAAERFCDWLRSSLPNTLTSGPYRSPAWHPVSASSVAPSPSLSTPSFDGSHTVKQSRICRLTGSRSTR